MKRTTQIGLSAAFVVAMGSGYLFGASNVTPVTATVDVAAQCQYPERDSNPQNGCDNSDPAIPECLGKTGAGEQACLAFVDQCLKTHTAQSADTLQVCLDKYRQSLHPVVAPTLPTPVVETAPATPVTCVEK